MRHESWEGITRQIALWHSDPNFEAFMHHLILATKPSRFIETGTQMGWTCGWVAQHYPGLPVHTVELQDRFFQLASENLAEYPSVKMTKGDSRDFIKQQCEELRSQSGIPLFWLDAHWWPPVPLRDECRAVASLDKYICVIDDFASKNPDFGGDVFDDPGGRVTNNLAYVADILGNRCWRPNYEEKPGWRGYGLFLKNVDYTPPSTLREDTL